MFGWRMLVEIHIVGDICLCLQKIQRFGITGQYSSQRERTSIRNSLTVLKQSYYFILLVFTKWAYTMYHRKLTTYWQLLDKKEYIIL